MCTWLCCVPICIDVNTVPSEARRVCWISWDWSWGQLWAILRECWDLNSGSQQVLLPLSHPPSPNILVWSENVCRQILALHMIGKVPRNVSLAFCAISIFSSSVNNTLVMCAFSTLSSAPRTTWLPFRCLPCSIQKCSHALLASWRYQPRL